MSDVRSHGEAALLDMSNEGSSGGAKTQEVQTDALFQFGFQITTQAIVLMRSLATTGMDGAAKMGCTLAVVNEALKKIGPQIPVPSWAKVGQVIVAKIVMATAGRMFAGVVEAIYQQTIRNPAAEPQNK